MTEKHKLKNARTPERYCEATEGDVICDLAELRKNTKEKAKPLQELK